jgi:hypothetical protein
MTNPRALEYLQARHPEVLKRFQKILLETEGSEAN